MGHTIECLIYQKEIIAKEGGPIAKIFFALLVKRKVFLFFLIRSEA